MNVGISECLQKKYNKFTKIWNPFTLLGTLKVYLFMHSFLFKPFVLRSSNCNMAS